MEHHSGPKLAGIVAQREGLATAVLTALGVVYGDIGTLAEGLDQPPTLVADHTHRAPSDIRSPHSRRRRIPFLLGLGGTR
jgi:hypothetical protein